MRIAPAAIVRLIVEIIEPNQQRVERELHQEIVGDESQPEIEDLVDEIFESEGIEYDDSDGDE